MERLERASAWLCSGKMVTAITRRAHTWLGAAVEKPHTYFLIVKQMTIQIYDDFFTLRNFNEISESVSRMKPGRDKRSNQRLFCVLDYDSDENIYYIIYKNRKLRNRIEKSFSLKHGLRKTPQFPIEYRIYPKGSKGMQKHRDVSLFSPHSIECVLTIKNNSDSKFVYEDEDGWVEVTPKPNQLIVVKSNGALHFVSPVNRGSRSILKFVYEPLNKNGTNRKTNEFARELSRMM